MPNKFEFPVELSEFFGERARQFAGWGVPAEVITRARERIADMWDAGPAGWVSVWSEQARAAEATEEWLTAAMCWGAARFPTIVTPERRAAYQRQLSCYQRAAAQCTASFERLTLDVTYRAETTTVPVHIWRDADESPRSLVLICGGVDTWKVELHRMAMAAAKFPGTVVAVVDMPGTGESEVPLAPAVDEILAEVVADLAHRFGVTRTGSLGVSFGGHWAVKLAFTGRIDAAVDLGGPVGATGSPMDISALPNGMPGILGNVLGLSGLPTSLDAARFAEDFSLRRQGLLDSAPRGALLAVNGAADPYVSERDTTVFAGLPNAAAWLVADAGHCATERLPVVLPAALAWLHHALWPAERPAQWLADAVGQLGPLLRDL
ncbi:esterase FrsA [Tamaricihabitans halophyticus]|uniref:Esterase FrsA n=1 Tax=Tamaricihabitans halophyticus TaxID=1262583 RepID=A0A4R2QX30_9PSEU|nr:alpha/beta hydrolase [Tamaricihabitans halophyticus]TCP53528.1 esterase FrsA [Tamaricihabitans halophyticus]